MQKYSESTIVVPWDFSELSKVSLSEAIEIAQSPELIKVIHVTPYPATTEYGMIWGSFTEVEIRENLEKSFEKESAEAGFPELSFCAEFGDPGSRIAEFAKAKNAGLVVISSHGHTGLSRVFLGSVAERVVRLSPCPVLVLRSDTNK